MPLVFLDTPQIDLLEKTRRNSPDRYSSVQTKWSARGCSLVFTATQASELGRYGNSISRQGRYSVLADLAPIRTDLPLPPDGAIKPRILFEHEIVRAICDRDLANAFGPVVEKQLQSWKDVLPGCLDTKNAFLLRVAEDESLQNVFNCMYEAGRFAANAERARASKRKTPHVRDLPTSPLSTENALVYRTELKGHFESRKDQIPFSSLPPGSAEAVLAIEDSALKFIDRMQEVGPRAALLEALPVTGLNTEAVWKQLGHGYANLWFFQFQVRKFAAELLGLGEQHQEFLVQTLCLADCPGSWLYFRLRRCIGRGSLKPLPNHLHDAERLAYLPYVDLLLTDAQMVEFVRQIQNDESTPVRIKMTRPPLSISHSIDALEEAINHLDS
ncbi:MAG: hypothetical protein ACRD3D_09455 [Terriglobia bacterium]